MRDFLFRVTIEHSNGKKDYVDLTVRASSEEIATETVKKRIAYLGRIQEPPKDCKIHLLDCTAS